MSKNKHILSIIIKSIILVSSIYGIIISYSGLISFTYFTILSNVFADIMILIYLIKDILNMMDKKIVLSKYLYITKFLSVISITLTFFVFMFILAPTMPGGIIRAYIGKDISSLCLHFIAPLLCVIDFLIFDNEYDLENKHIIYSIMPPLLYVLFIIVLGLFGVRWFKMMAPYNFLNYGSTIGWFGFDLNIMSWDTFGIGTFYMIIILILIFLVIGKVFISIKNKLKKGNKNDKKR